MSDEQHKVPERISRMVERAETALSADKTNGQRYTKLVHGVLPKKRSGRSNIFVRKIHAFVENAVARYASAMFQYQPYFDIESRSARNVKRADNAELVLQYYLERTDLPFKSVGWFKQSTIEGLGVMKLGWRKAVRQMRQRLPLDEAMKNVKDFELPEELQGLHVFMAPDGITVATDESKALITHQGDEPDEVSANLEAQGFTRITLDVAPPEVQHQFTVVAEAPKVLYDGLEVIGIDFQDFFYDPDASTVEELRYAGHHFGRTIADLKAEKKSGIPYKNLDKLEEWASAGGVVPDIARYKRRQDIGKSTSTSEYSEDGTVFKVTEFWHVQEATLYTWVTTGFGDKYGWDGIVIRKEKWPFWHGELPYHLLPASIIPFELIGIGVPELMEHLQNERNDIRNIAMDVKALTLMPPWIANTQFVTDLSKLQNIQPNRIIEIDGSDRPISEILQQVKVDPNVLQTAQFLIQQIDNDAEEVTGITKTALGIPIQRRSTYSETALLANESNMRFKMQLILIDQVFKRLARQSLRNLDQFCDPQIEVPITGDDQNRAFAEVDREDLSFEYDIYPSSSSAESLANQQAQAQNMIQGYAAIRGSSMESVLKIAPFTREYFRKMGIKSVDRFIKTDEELQKEIEEQRRLQAEAIRNQQNTQNQPPPNGQQPPNQPPVEQQRPDESELINEENETIMQGQAPPVSPRNDHGQHITGHDAAYQRIVEENGGDEQAAQRDERFVILMNHVKEHGQYAQAGAAGAVNPQGMA